MRCEKEHIRIAARLDALPRCKGRERVPPAVWAMREAALAEIRVLNRRGRAASGVALADDR